MCLLGPMKNIKIVLAYDGTRYNGWQTQTSRQKKNAGREQKTVQAEIERALLMLFGEKIVLEASGRTDSGVHAMAQVAHFRLEKPFDLKKLPAALNAQLPSDITVLSAKEVSHSFHARFDAEKKLYRYCIVNASRRPLFVSGLAAWVRHPLDTKSMKQASRALLGRHDFRSFQATDSKPRRSVTTVHKITIKKVKADPAFPFLERAEWVTIDIEARGFLRNMARNIVGTLIEVGRGRLAAEKVGSILKKKDRRHPGPCAPAQGLYLMKVRYD